MLQRNLLAGICLALLLGMSPVHAAAPVSVCDPNNPSHCEAPNADGSINVTGGGGVQNLPLGENNSTIAVTNTFQQALAGNMARKSCTIQNQGTHVMYVYASETNTPTTANSVQLNPGQQFSCQGTAQILITGTASDAYVVTNQ